MAPQRCLAPPQPVKDPSPVPTDRDGLSPRERLGMFGGAPPVRQDRSTTSPRGEVDRLLTGGGPTFCLSLGVRCHVPDFESRNCQTLADTPVEPGGFPNGSACISRQPPDWAHRVTNSKGANQPSPGQRSCGKIKRISRKGAKTQRPRSEGPMFSLRSSRLCAFARMCFGTSEDSFTASLASVLFGRPFRAENACRIAGLRQLGERCGLE